MNFAIQQMKSMGWSEGKGLGLAENGITKPLKPDIQTDKRGLGFTVEDSIQLKNQWWYEAYNAASKGLKSEYKITSVGVVVKPKQSEDNSEDQSSEKIYSQHFVSSGLLARSDDEDLDKNDEKTRKKRKKKSKTDKAPTADQSMENSDESSKQRQMLDFNKVFEKSKGMTCHKAARLGIKMNGKMKRIQEQEEEFLKKFKKS